ncbi:dipeptide ABC transporter ATP-binding protein [Streptomyces fulvoviolaceus]|uniref:dipeptide ABC transporter ATP-binding protein n=1 Tax=Streptomyces fulvoviolaceus TaxID=285535 RepID=UPI0021C0D7A3|nr:ABC transporter ATP-binding protein [Streptomyces fulvoviolaceus]MCT9084547.1 ABC transporter ATP-binding protein [Streptomyces fulvoviolaceus]
MSLLAVEGLDVRFGAVHAVRDVSFSVASGECLALVGESGSGKSTAARALLGLTGPGARTTARTLRVDGRDATAFGAREWRTVRGGTVGLVSQDALVSLDPLRRVGAEVAEPLRLHRTVEPGRIRERVVELLREVGVPEPEARAAQYPHELSGGLRQRALIASALAAEPKLLVADEPTTALDVTVQAQVLDLLARAGASGMGLLLISHDLGVVARIADRTAVLRKGAVVESGATAELLRSPRHPFTRVLVEASAARPPREPSAVSSARRLLEVSAVSKAYGSRTAAHGVSFALHAGETVGLVGESGSGKSTVARIAMGLLAPDSGTVTLAGDPWSALPERRRRPLRHRLQLVHQDPYSSLDPRFTVARVLAEALPGHPDRRARTLELLDLVGLGPEHLGRRPHQLSGGQRQRVAIARALAPAPEILVCDEPVSALDASVQDQILRLLEDLRQRLGLALLFISHDLGVIRRISDRVLVMKDARVVEEGTAAEVLTDPRHPYTRALLAAVPSLPGPVGAPDRA